MQMRAEKCNVSVLTVEVLLCCSGGISFILPCNTFFCQARLQIKPAKVITTFNLQLTHAGRALKCRSGSTYPPTADTAPDNKEQTSPVAYPRHLVFQAPPWCVLEAQWLPRPAPSSSCAVPSAATPSTTSPGHTVSITSTTSPGHTVSVTSPASLGHTVSVTSPTSPVTR